ncbi:hypothetical protein [Roseicitreum antarcticum]|uniref:hypothetical protein n=1 Tax=Roseicitreum antarcticum TaxID=564137 RepID=UPI00168058B8|nr:hypothetical protein [Roseicitreum antarcticum]
MLRTASVFAGGLNGQAFVLGDAGCMVSDLSIAAGGDFIFGPTTWNGAPAGAVETVSGGTGRILGAVIRAGAFSEDEIDRLIRFARACGAGPLSEINPWQPQALGAGVVDLSRLDLAYTDTAGTLLAQPGQAVAALRDGNGAVVATQATSAARQTYGRHPASGIRNRAKRSADVGSAVAWPETNVANGITCTKAGSGIDTDGLPFVLYDVVGTATAVSFFSIVSPDLTRSAALSGQTWTGSYLVQRVSGAAPGNAQTGVRIDVRGETAPNSETEATFGEPVAPATETLRTISRTLDNAATNQVRANLAIRVENGDTVDFRVKIKALQFEQGGVRSVYQAALSEFDISEAGQRSVYYLKPDGIDDWMSFATRLPQRTVHAAAIVNRNRVSGADVLRFCRGPVVIQSRAWRGRAHGRQCKQRGF